MIHSTKRDQYWSFWCWGWSDHLNQEVFWGNWAVEAVEASEVAEATKVNLVIWVPGMIQPSGSVKKLMKWGCRGHWGYWGCWGCWGHWGCRCSKDWKITTEDFRVIQVLEFSFILMFWKKKCLVESWKISCWILAYFLSEAVEASLCHFFEIFLMKLKCWILGNMLTTMNVF